MASAPLPVLTIEALKTSAGRFAKDTQAAVVPELFGITDGKAVGAFVALGFRALLETEYRVAFGNAASGLDFPSLGVDLKTTSLSQPQSSCPFQHASEKVYG